MKVYCINFQGVAEGQRTNALVRGMFDMFRRLDPSKYVFLNCSLDKDYGPNFHCLNKYQLFFYKVFNAVSIKLRIPSYIRRTILEKIVDNCLYKYLKKEKDPFLLITTMYSVKCTRYAKRKGYKVVLWAGNLNDNLYYETVKKEQKRLSLHYTDVYTSEFRINVYKRMLENIDYVYCLNPLTAWSFEGKKILLDTRTRKKVKPLYPKVYESKLPENIVIGYFGHTTLLKGVHQLAEALVLCKHKNNIRFVIAGGVDNYVKSVLSKYDIDIKFKGFVAEEEKWNTIQSFDYMIVPSLYDAGPSTIAEAYKCDVPVIVSSGCGEVDRYRNDPKCIVFKTMDIRDLANKLDYAYENRFKYLCPNVIDDSYGDTSMTTENLDFFTDLIDNLCGLS